MIKNISIEIDFDSVERDAQKQAQREAATTARYLVDQMFKNGRTTWSSPEGLAHEIVRKKVEDLILSDEFSKTIDRLISEHFEQQAAEAVKALLNSKSRKYLFEDIEHKPT